MLKRGKMVRRKTNVNSKDTEKKEEKCNLQTHENVNVNYNSNYNGFFVPTELWQDSRLSKITLGVLLMIRALENDENGCFAHNKFFADYFNVTKKHISSCIQTLIDTGYIVSNNKFNQDRVLRSVERNDTQNEQDPKLQKYPKKNPKKTTQTADTKKCRSLTPNGSTQYIKDISYNNTFINIKDKWAPAVPKQKFRIPKCSLDLISLWNKIKHTPNHKHETKIHAKVNRYANQLLNGTFTRHNSIHPGFLASLNLTRGECSGHYSPQEIENAVKNMAKMYQDGMEPENKEWLKTMNLATLIYNERSRKSQLLKCLHFDIRPLNEVINYHSKINANPAWLEQIQHIINEKKLKPMQKVTLRKNIVLIDKYYDWMWDYPLEKDPRLKSMLPDENVFFDWYERWLLQIPKVYPWRIGPNAQDWPLFLAWLTEECLNSKTSIIDSDYGLDYLNYSGLET